MMKKLVLILLSIAMLAALFPLSTGTRGSCISFSASVMDAISCVSAVVKSESPLAEQYRARNNEGIENREAGAMERITAGAPGSMSVLKSLYAAGTMMWTGEIAQQANAANRAQAPPWDVGMIFIVILMYFVILSRSNLPWATGEYCLEKVRTRR